MDGSKPKLPGNVFQSTEMLLIPQERTGGVVFTFPFPLSLAGPWESPVGSLESEVPGLSPDWEIPAPWPPSLSLSLWSKGPLRTSVGGSLLSLARSSLAKGRTLAAVPAQTVLLQGLFLWEDGPLW